MGKFPSPFLKSGLPAFLSAIALLGPLCAHGLGIPYLRPQSTHPLVVGYFTQGGIYYPRPFYLKTLVTNGSAAHLDQINYSQGSVSGGRCSVADPRSEER